MNPRDADPLYFTSDKTAMEEDIARYSSVPWDAFAALPDPDPLHVPEPQYATIRDRPGITIPLVLAAVLVVAVVLAVWGGGTR